MPWAEQDRCRRRWRASIRDFGTPTNAILVQTFITLTLGIAIGLWIGPDQEYFFIGVVMTLVLIFIYSAGNLGVYFFYRRDRPAEFSILLHVLFPIASTLSMLWVAYHSVVPLPEKPLRYAPIVVGVWMLAGVVVMLTFRRATNMPLLALDNPDVESQTV